MHRFRLVIALVALSTGALVSVTPAVAGAGSSAAVKARLLTLTELPTGWAALNASAASTGLTKNKCIAGLTKAAKHVSTGSAAFQDNGLVPILFELLVSGRGASAVFTKAKKDLAACHTLSISADGVKLSGKVSPLTFPTVGTASTAYSVALTFSGIAAGLDGVLFRSGTYVGFVAFANEGTPNIATFQAFADEAVTKAQGQPVSPPAVTTSVTTTTG
jgi:hypothetical protein